MKNWCQCFYNNNWNCISYTFMCLSTHLTYDISQQERENIMFRKVLTAHCCFYLTHIGLLLDWPQWRLQQRCGVHLLRLWEQESLRSSKERKRKFVLRVLTTDLDVNDLSIWFSVGEGGVGEDKFGSESESVSCKQVRCTIKVRRLFCSVYSDTVTYQLCNAFKYKMFYASTGPTLKYQCLQLQKISPDRADLSNWNECTSPSLIFIPIFLSQHIGPVSRCI